MSYEKYDLRWDFKEVREVCFTETLSGEETLEGLVPETYFFIIGITDHSIKRMFDDRDVEWEEVEDLVLEKGNKILMVRNQEKFIVMRSDEKLALVFEMFQQDGYPILILKTVIKKVFVSKKGFYETGKKVKFKESDKKYII